MEDCGIDGPGAQQALDMIKAGMSEDTFYSLFVRCFICRQVVLGSQFPQDHHCCEKVTPAPEQESPRPIHLLSITDMGDGRTAEIPTDVDTDVEVEDADHNA
jgi:hypothetical protein